MEIVFIADAHLKGIDDPDQKSLAAFLDNLHTDMLVILGDLFDFWTGFTGVVYNRYLPVLDSLLRLKQRGTRIIYMEGNHDFSMGDFFTEVLEAEVRPDGCEFTLDGRRFYLAHGDTVSMTTGYRVWRGFLRSAPFRALTKVLTPGFALMVADRLSRRSRTKNRMGEAVEKNLRKFAGERLRGGVDFVVLAHSHVPGVHTEDVYGTYANPGSWAGRKNYLVYSEGVFRLVSYPG